MFQSKDGVSDTLSSYTKVKGRLKVDMKHKKIDLGPYVMFHIDTTNTMKIRDFSSIVLKVPNDSGGYYFMNIFTRK